MDWGPQRAFTGVQEGSRPTRATACAVPAYGHVRLCRCYPKTVHGSLNCTQSACTAFCLVASTVCGSRHGLLVRQGRLAAGMLSSSLRSVATVVRYQLIETHSTGWTMGEPMTHFGVALDTLSTSSV